MSTQPFKKVQLHADEQDGCWLTTTLNDGRQLAPQQVSPVAGWRFAKGYHHPDNMYVGRRLRKLVLERQGEQLAVGWTGNGWEMLNFVNRKGLMHNFFGYREQRT